MISGGLEQYVVDWQVLDATERLQIVCPASERLRVLDNLYENDWEVTRSGPMNQDFAHQLILAERRMP